MVVTVVVMVLSVVDAAAALAGKTAFLVAARMGETFVVALIAAAAARVLCESVSRCLQEAGSIHTKQRCSFLVRRSRMCGWLKTSDSSKGQ